MSDFSGPWMLSNGNLVRENWTPEGWWRGWREFPMNAESIPLWSLPSGAIPLVPQTRNEQFICHQCGAQSGIAGGYSDDPDERDIERDADEQFRVDWEREHAGCKPKHKGPWVLPNGNEVRWIQWSPGGPFLFREYAPTNATANNDWGELPADAIPLVPQTEVDAANAEAKLQRQYRVENREWAERAEERANGLEAELAEAQVHADYLLAELSGAEVRVARLEDDLANADAELEDRQVAPSLPAVDVTDPDQARFVADWLGLTSPHLFGVATADEFTTSGHYWLIEGYAKGLEREQANEKLTEQVAKTIYESDRDAGLQPEGQEWNPNGLDHRDYDVNAVALLARFNITLKDES